MTTRHPKPAQRSYLAILSAPLVYLVVGLIRLYQRLLSPLHGPCCRFRPTCSQYFIEALQKRGLIMGFILGCYRILRCHPFCQGGYDPVPERSGKISEKARD